MKPITIFEDPYLALSYLEMYNATVTAILNDVTYKIKEECEGSFQLIDTMKNVKWATYGEIEEYHVQFRHTDDIKEPIKGRTL